MYHIWTHANGNENLFRDDENYRHFLDRYAKHVHPVVETFAYCLMPNHLHLMVRVREEAEVLEYLRIKRQEPDLQGFENLGGLGKVISQQFSNLFNAYTKAYNNKYGRRGSLFSPNFKRKHVDTVEYYTKLIVYIHNNPIHHGFAKKPADWLYSSWHAYNRMNQKTNISRGEGFDWFGGIEIFDFLHAHLKTGELITIFE